MDMLVHHLLMTDGLLVGRFQPFHLGHLAALKFALTVADHLWVGLGSSNRPIEEENPFTAPERKKMILSSMHDDDMSRRISIYEIPDVDNHIKWMELIDQTVPPFSLVFTNDDLTRHLYSQKRPGVRTIKVPFLNRSQLSGTRIRSMIKKEAHNQNDSDDGIAGDQNWRTLVPAGTLNMLRQCDIVSRFANL